MIDQPIGRCCADPQEPETRIGTRRKVNPGASPPANPQKNQPRPGRDGTSNILWNASSDHRQINKALRDVNFKKRSKTQEIAHASLSRLQPGEWLDDEVINFYGALVQARSDGEFPELQPDQGSSRNVHYFNSFFYSKLSQQGYEASRLKRWTKKVGLSACSDAQAAATDGMCVAGRYLQHGRRDLSDQHRQRALDGGSHQLCQETLRVLRFYGRLHQLGIAGLQSQSHQDHPVLQADDEPQNMRHYLEAEHQDKKSKPFDFTDWREMFDIVGLFTESDAAKLTTSHAGHAPAEQRLRLRCLLVPDIGGDRAREGPCGTQRVGFWRGQYAVFQASDGVRDSGGDIGQAVVMCKEDEVN